MPTVTKRELVERVADATAVPRVSTRAVVAEFLEQVMRALVAGDRLELRDFGVFEPRLRRSRVARNPKTLDEVDVPARRTVRFKPSRRLRAELERRGGGPRATIAASGSTAADRRGKPNAKAKPGARGPKASRG